jgi:signal peptidase I
MSKPAKPGFWSPENLRSLFVLLLLIFCFRWSVASPYHVPTASMEPTIKVGDRLLAFKLSYDFKLPFTEIDLASWAKPDRGDIVVFRYPKDPDIDYVKRVIGVPGDKIYVEENVVYINGVAQKQVSFDSDRSILTDINDNPDQKNLFKEDLSGVEHWVIQNKSDFRLSIFGNRFPSEGEFVVPEDSYFVMGDNRDNSTDSRAWGVVPKSYVKGKALFVIWSVFAKGDELIPDLRFNRFGYWLH